MSKRNYVAITTRKLSDGTKRENHSIVKLPADMRGLRKQFGEDISNSSLTSKIYKNGIVYQNDKQSGISVRYIPVEDKSGDNKQKNKRK